MDALGATFPGKVWLEFIYVVEIISLGYNYTSVNSLNFARMSTAY